MVAPLVIAVAQPFTVSHDVVGNAQRHAALIRQSGAHVVVFPEMSLTGYELSAPAIDPADDRLRPLLGACKEHGAVALVGAPVHASGGAASIGLLLVGALGVSVAYRKMWLSGTEARSFMPGDGPSVIKVRGWRLGLAVCKDTGVSQHASDTAHLGMDIYVAGVLEHQTDSDVQPTRAQGVAAAHDVWVAVASFAGSTGGGFNSAAGGSGIWRPDGTAAARAGSRSGEVVATTVGSEIV